MGEKVVVNNKRARRDYQVLDSYEAGIELKGTEVKSLRAGKMVLKDSYVDIRHGELYLVSAHIAPYDFGNIHNHEPERDRRLLMHKREIVRLATKVAEKGFTLVPLKVYFKNGRAKVEVGVCRGKHHADKRDVIKEREAKIEMGRELKEARGK